MRTRSQTSVLGKRPHQADGKPASVASTVDQAGSQAMPTPDLTPKTKRARVSLSFLDGESNKENVPPFRTEGSAVSPTSPPPSLRRTSTEMITPSRARTNRGRHASTSNIQTLPTTDMSALALSTPPPTPHATLLPIHARARTLLRATCNDNSSITGRTTERETIKNFISSSWESQSTCPSLFISGTPGTGKTALVNAVLKELEEDCDVEVISVNCMAYRNTDALWDHLHDTFVGSQPLKGSPRKAKAKFKPLLDDLLASRKRRCLLVLDELDHIANSCRSLSAIFSLARKHTAILRIIGIANTHTLTASTTLLGDDTTEIPTLHFGGYTSSQLLDVLKARLSSLFEPEDDHEVKKRAQKFLPIATLTLLAKKVASQTGDVRMLFGVLRGAIDKAVSSPYPSAEENPLAVSVPVVTPTHILDALKAYLPSNDARRNNVMPTAASTTSSSSSEIVTKVRGFGLQARLVLLSMLLATKRMEAFLPLAFSISSPPKTPVKRLGSMGLTNKSAGLDLAQIHSYYTAILSRTEHDIFTPVSQSEFADLLGVLETSGLISSSTSCSAVASPSKSGRRGFGRSTSFGAMAKSAAAGQDIRIADTVRIDEVLRGLGVADSHAEITDPREEEVRAIWVRESARIAKDVKLRAQSKGSANDLIEGAFEN
ncbi:P-loop containing nucleoside triphosphate hydrolase protein [Pisolithus orientalis]|uniref:P-loop containing nucleoside triphosphate hydrolase protein n=1 Tax=Pisolithus orientalis TaxID=936130 RepID=UPI00222549A3|nr:P-loop containing nucleoside triphosphate hydrolase protein [Pisolithus orientalis]KAI6032639.1 P-loop containing nucleoside triphosphate hydrolase protein [Pisolithus orientalis]